MDLPPISDLRDPPTRCAMPVGDFPYVPATTDEPDQPQAPVLLTIGEVAARLRMRKIGAAPNQGRNNPRRPDRRETGADLV
jgi:hypothetical protein